VTVWRRSGQTDNLLLIAATTIVILTAQRYFQEAPSEPPDSPAEDPAAARPDFAPELSEQGRGRRSENPFQIPWAG
jgi:membrane protein